MMGKKYNEAKQQQQININLFMFTFLLYFFFTSFYIDRFQPKAQLHPTFCSKHNQQSFY